MADQPQLDWAALLTGLTPIIEDRYYAQKRVNLDGYHFKNCLFERCEIVTGKGTFQLTNCKFVNCSLEYGLEAGRAFSLHCVLNTCPSGWTIKGDALGRISTK